MKTATIFKPVNLICGFILISLSIIIFWSWTQPKDSRLKKTFQRSLIAGEQGICTDALSILEDALKIEPQNIEINIAYSFAKDCLEGKMPTEGVITFFKGMRAADKNETDDALIFGKEISSKYPNYPFAHNYLGYLYLKMGNNYYDKAATSFNEALKIDSRQGLPNYCLALIYAYQSNWKSSKDCFINASEMNYFVPDNFLSLLPNDIITKKEKESINIRNERIKARIDNIKQDDDIEGLFSKLWPFGPKGWICKHVAPSAYTVSEQMLWYKIGGCLKNNR